MGSKASKPQTPLACFTANWNNAKKNYNFGIKLKKERMQTLCQIEWQIIQSDWPAEGSFNENIIRQLWLKILKDYPEQVPYIEMWRGNVKSNPSWIRNSRDLPPQAKLLALRKKEPVLESHPEEYDPLSPPPPYAPDGQRGNPNAPPEPNLAAGAQAVNATPPTPREAPKAEPPARREPPQSSRTDEKREGGGEEEEEEDEFRQRIAGNFQWNETDHKKVKEVLKGNEQIMEVGNYILAAGEERNWQKRQKYLLKAYDAVKRYQKAEGRHKLMPLRRVYDPLTPDHEGPRTSTMQHVPFTSSDIINWKNTLPSIDDDPDKVYSTIDSIFGVSTSALWSF